MPQFNVILTETPYEIIERICRWANILAYENTDGNLVIAWLGDAHMASGFAQGQNVQQASVSFSTDDRFTEIDPLYLSTAFLTDGGDSIPFIKNAGATDTSFPARADRLPRYRSLLIVSEQNQNSDAIEKARAQWDMARRTGRSQSIHLTRNSWRDSAGTLWTPNARAAINLPALKFENQIWLISQVTLARGEGLTTAEVTLMPRSAFVPAPENLIPFDWQIAQALPDGGETDSAPAPR